MTATASPIRRLATPCRIWTGTKTWNGYGTKYDKRYRKSPVLVHRWVVAQIHGWDALEGKVVMHLCHNRACFRYDHLQVGTQSENLLMSSENMARDVAGVKNSQSKLTEHQVLEIFHSGDTQMNLAAQYGVSQATISGIKTGANWSHVTGSEQSEKVEDNDI